MQGVFGMFCIEKNDFPPYGNRHKKIDRKEGAT